MKYPTSFRQGKAGAERVKMLRNKSQSAGEVDVYKTYIRQRARQKQSRPRSVRRRISGVYSVIEKQTV
jgi:hypothetical protein